MILFNKKKFFAIFVIKQNNGFEIIGSKRILPTTKSVSFKKKSYILDIEKPTYTKRLKIFYFFCLNLNKQLSFNEGQESSFDSDVIDLVMSQKIVQQLTANLNQDFKMNMMTIIVGMAIGIMIGYMYAQYTLTPTINGG